MFYSYTTVYRLSNQVRWVVANFMRYKNAENYENWLQIQPAHRSATSRSALRSTRFFPTPTHLTKALRCDRSLIINDHFIANFLESVSVKEF